MARWVAPVLLIAPVLALGAATIPLADYVARHAAVTLDRALGALTRPALQPPPLVFVEPDSALDIPAAREADPLPRSVKPARATKKASAPKKGVRVRADAVLRLANAGARPAGIPVPARGERPAGLALVGVSALGIGLVDGDVLTQAAGRPALAPGDVIGVVIGARAKRVPEICGQFWRKGEPYNLIVEQPYVAPRRGRTAQTGS